jgi:L-asparaginase / beta-aspartyl-peptidase
VNFIAQDQAGRIASAVSTSGWAWKYPGRLGDSPIVGAGNYADDRYGAAGCTGWGELALRASTARTVVLLLATGMPLAEACAFAFRDLHGLAPTEQLLMNMVALDATGQHCGVSTSPGKTYIYQRDDMATHAEIERTVVQL